MNLDLGCDTDAGLELDDRIDLWIEGLPEPVARHLDGLHVDAIGRREIAAMIAKRRAEGALNATVRRDLTAVSRVFASAIAAGLCERNPALEYDRGMVRERRDPVSLPTGAEIHAALAACPSDAFRRIVAFAWPVWMYVSVTGVVIYGMLYRIDWR